MTLTIIDPIATSPSPKTIRIQGTAGSEGELAVHLIQEYPGDEPGEETEPTGVVSVTPGEPFSFDVAVPTEGSYRVHVRGAKALV